MSCNQKCNQGRDCTCGPCYEAWSAKVIAVILTVGLIVLAVAACT